MIVPEYWSEARSTVTIDGRQRTIMRFGWSDESEAAATEHARRRVGEALGRLRAGEKVRPRDHKVPYNGAEGLPIREEIVARHGDAIVTRNSYGALCLNTPDVVFADVDVEPRSHFGFSFAVFAIFVLAGFAASRLLGSWWALGAAVLLGAFVSDSIGRRIAELVWRRQQEPLDLARARIEAFAERNSDWLLRVYRTPMGYRVLVMHETFDPRDEAAFEFMEAIGSDPLYVRMCRNQKCFRARVSPKPWRIDVEHIRPRPGVWPVKDERLPARREWIRSYESKADGYASCRYELTLGRGRTKGKCDDIRRVHDRYCKAETGLAIA